MTKQINTNIPCILGLIAIVCIMILFPYFKSDMHNRPLFEKLGFTPQGQFYKIILGEFRWFVGDYLSFKSMFYYGGKVGKIKEEKFGGVEFYNLYRTIQASILLNPYNEDAYYFAQAVFTWNIGRIKEVNALLRYVMKYRRWDFKIPFFLGFNYAYFLKDFRNAAYFYKKASEISRSPLFVNLSSRFFYEGGETELGIAYLKTMIKLTRSESIKKSYVTRLNALESISLIEKAVKQYKKQYEKLPNNINELVKKGFLEKLPEDSYGGKFYIDREGKVRTTSNLVFRKQGRNNVWKQSR